MYHKFLLCVIYTFFFSTAKPRTSLRQPEYRSRQGRGSSRTVSMRETQPDGRGSKVHNTPPNMPSRRGSLPSDKYDRYERIEGAAGSRLFLKGL